MSLQSKDSLLSKLRNRAYRSAFLSSRINNMLAFQIRALRQEKKDWTQAELAKKLGTSQNAVYRMEQSDYGKQSLTTLKRLADIFDVALVVKFVPFSEVINRTVNLRTQDVVVPTFDEEFNSEREQPSIAETAVEHVGPRSLMRQMMDEYRRRQTIRDRTIEVIGIIPKFLTGFVSVGQIAKPPAVEQGLDKTFINEVSDAGTNKDWRRLGAPQPKSFGEEPEYAKKLLRRPNQLMPSNNPTPPGGI